MSEPTTAAINKPAVKLLLEVIDGPADPDEIWIIGGAPRSCLLGTLEQFSAEQASRAPALGRKTPAAHTSHLLFSLELAIQRLEGQNPPAGLERELGAVRCE